MTIEMIPLTKLKPSTDNPRKVFDDASIAGLALSIKTDGLLQNIVAAKPKGRKRIYHIISGERRYRALKLLVDQGDLPNDLSVPVDVRVDVTADDALRIATVENIQREDLSPLEEADAIAVLVDAGGSMDEISAQTGLSLSTIKRRIALLELSDMSINALQQEQITLAQAEAISLGNHKQQSSALLEVIHGWCSSVDDIKKQIVGDAPSVSDAIFDMQAYTGTLTTDLFGKDETTYFDDVEQFYELQKVAAEKRVAELDAKHDWVEFTEGWYSSIAYREADEGETGGAVVCLTSNGSVEIHEGLIRKDIDSSISEATTAKPKATYAKPVRQYFAMQKSAAVQMGLLRSPRHAKDVLVADMLRTADAHDCVRYLQIEDEGGVYLQTLAAEAAALLSLLGQEKSDEPLQELFWLSRSREHALTLVQTLDDPGLERLLTFLSAIRFGQRDCDELDTNRDSMFNSVARDVDVDMRTLWTPDVWFLRRRSMAQLQGILKESGLSRLYGTGKGYKKSELVTAMAGYFAKVKGLDICQPDQQVARDWLPEAMQFPAIDPDTDEKIEDAEVHTQAA